MVEGARVRLGLSLLVLGSLLFGSAIAQAEPSDEVPLCGVRVPPLVPDPISPPPGCHFEQRPVYGLIFTGGVMAVVGGLLIGAGEASAHSAIHDHSYWSNDARGDAVDIASAVESLGLLHVGLGMSLVGAGLLFRRTEIVPNRAATIGFMPVIGPNHLGAQLSLRF